MLLQIEILSVLLSAVSIQSALASMPAKLYQSALQAAEKRAVSQIKVSTESALSSSALKALFGRYYSVGDNWDVASWQIENPAMTPPYSTRKKSDFVGTGCLFHYQVASVKTGFSPEVVIKISQIKSDGFSIADPKVDYLVLSMNDQTVQSKKEYLLRGNPNPLTVPTNGLHIQISPLESFALDLPEIHTAEKIESFSLPVLPKSIQAYAERIHFNPDLSKSSWFEQDDFFGRPVQILWEQGNPWPTYLKNSNGVSILIHKEIK
jgi:hypothetical protein